MINIDKIRREYGGNICRRCINVEYDVELNPDDCIYEDMSLCECSRCHNSSHLVSGLSRSGKLKTIFK